MGQIQMVEEQTNKTKIAQFIRFQGETSKTEIATNLKISMPTVLQNLKDLSESGMIEEIGCYESTGGRKAKRLAIVAGYRKAIGIDITANHLSFVMIDLQEQILFEKRLRVAFHNDFDYYENVFHELERFILDSKVKREDILGVGISMPGIVDHEKSLLVKSHVLQISNVSLMNLSQLCPFPIYVENDANSAAMAEAHEVTGNAIYLSLSNSVGGAIYLNQEIYKGNHFRSGEFGHFIIEVNGRECYCGKKGCFDAYCSARVLSSYTDGNLEEFFERLKNKDQELEKVWDSYLDYLAIGITNLRMSFDCDIILGGYVGAFLKDYLLDLNKKMMKYNKFEDDTTYIKVCKYKNESSAVGAATYFIEAMFQQLS